MPIREMQEFIALHNSELSTITTRWEFMETYRRKVIDQMKELEKTLEKIDNNLFSTIVLH